MEAGKEEDVAAQSGRHEEEDAAQTGTPHGDVVAATGEQGVTPIPAEGTAAQEGPREEMPTSQPQKGEEGTEAAQTRQEEAPLERPTSSHEDRGGASCGRGRPSEFARHGGNPSEDGRGGYRQGPSPRGREGCGFGTVQGNGRTPGRQTSQGARARIEERRRANKLPWNKSVRPPKMKYTAWDRGCIKPGLRSKRSGKQGSMR